MATLRVPLDVVCPRRAIDGYTSTATSKPYFTQLLTPLASPHHLLALCDSPGLVLFDKTRLAAPVQSIQVPSAEALTAVQNTEAAHAAWLAASRGGFVALWDARANETAPSMQFAGPSNAPYLSLATSGQYFAAGTELKASDAYIDLWDVRQMGAPVCTYAEAHSDDVMSLCFHPERERHEGVLLSGGMDGLVCAIDTRLTEEEDAVISVGNTNASLARVGWAAMPPDYAYTPRIAAVNIDMDEKDTALCSDPRRTRLGPVHAVSNMQTLSLWDADKFDCLVESADVRAPTSFRPPWVSDYVIDAWAQGPGLAELAHHAAGLGLWVGDQEGGFALVTAVADASPNGSALDWTLRARIPSAEKSARAHADIVRSVLWDDVSQRLFTGGEYGQVLAWALENAPDGGEEPLSTSTNAPSHAAGGGRSRSRGGSAGLRRRFAPYA